MKKSIQDRLKPVVISSLNLSHAWGEALTHVVDHPGNEITPLVISLSGFESDGSPKEDLEIRNRLDQFLIEEDKFSVEIVAFTIFPQRYWQIAAGCREDLYCIYRDSLPHIKAQNPHDNANGLYFERLINYVADDKKGNQLEYMLEEHAKNHNRRSQYQAVIFDPTRDHTAEPYQAFPCLQSISFVKTEAGLVVNGFYAMQYLVEKAYGNLLGLSHLGAFMAQEMKMNLAQVNMFAGVEKMTPTKTRVGELSGFVKERLAE